jgi:alpha-methylacyl-CoA racemase
MSQVPPLAGARVVSAGHTLPGMYCLAMLRDLGAEVVRVERPSYGTDADRYAGVSPGFPIRSLVAGTSACRLDLKQARGRELFAQLAGRADVVLTGFRPGVAERLGIGYAELSSHRPELVYASITGYGSEGPWRERVGHDLNYLAETGALGLANPAGLPGTTFADGLAGMGAALNVLAALLAVQRGGRGQYLDLAIVDAPLFLLASEFERGWRSGQWRGAGDSHLTGRYPWYGVHRTADGAHVAVGAVESHFYAALCRELGLQDLAREQFAEGERLERARRAFGAAFAARTRDQWAGALDGSDACVSPVLSTEEVARSELMARAVRPDPGPAGGRLVRTPVRLEPAPFARERSCAELLGELGLGAAEIAELERAGVVGSSA